MAVYKRGMRTKRITLKEKKLFKKWRISCLKASPTHWKKQFIRLQVKPHYGGFLDTIKNTVFTITSQISPLNDVYKAYRRLFIEWILQLESFGPTKKVSFSIKNLLEQTMDRGVIKILITPAKQITDMIWKESSCHCQW